jgi:acyl-CoA synthetase (AMP-forming)/AMP-acid ligase II
MGDAATATLLDALRRHARDQSSKTAFVALAADLSPAAHLTYADLLAEVLRRAECLNARGLSGRNLAVMPTHGLEFVVDFLAVVAGGGAAVPLSPRLGLGRGPSLSAILNDADVPAVIADERLAARLARGRSAADVRVEILGGAAPDATDDRSYASSDPEPDDNAVIQYTSGSSGSPKGVQITHRNLVANANLLTETFHASRMEVTVSWLPLFHDMGLMTGVVWPLVAGAQSVLLPPSSFAARPLCWLEALSKFGGTVSAAPDFAYAACAGIPLGESVGLDLSKWRIAICGGEPVRPDTVERFSERFLGQGFRPEHLFPSYGLAEATLFASGGRRTGGPRFLDVATSVGEGRGEEPSPQSRVKRLVSCGRPGTNLEVVIVDPASRERLAEGQSGEIWIAGPSVSPGYLGRPEANAAVFGARLGTRTAADEASPFLRTGDLGLIEGGDLFVTGRLKDLIVVRGENHWPQDLEAAASTAHPSTGSGAAIAFSISAPGGEAAVIVQEIPREAVADAEAVVEAICLKLARDHGLRLEAVVLVPLRGLPRTTSGKVRRRPACDAWLGDALEVLHEWRRGSGRGAADSPEGAEPDIDGPADFDVDRVLAELRECGVFIGLDGEAVRLSGPLSENRRLVAQLKSRRNDVVARLQAEAAEESPRTSKSVFVGELISRPARSEFASLGAGGFAALLEPARFASRSTMFDSLIKAGQSHFWDPLDQQYLDLQTPFDIARTPLLSEDGFPCLAAPSVCERLSTPELKAEFINTTAWFRFSTLLHGEQGALNLSASLCGLLKEPAAQEFVAGQVREEARHVTGFAAYIRARWGRPAPCPSALKGFLGEIVSSDDIAKKVIGMQVMVEGLAMGSLAALHRDLRDPAGRRLVQLVMTDEAFHHRFGTAWCEAVLPPLTPADRRRVQTWTSHCLQTFIVRMAPPIDLFVLKQRFGLEPAQIVRELAALAPDLGTTPTATQQTFRVLSRALYGAGLLSDADQHTYRDYLSSDGLADDDASEAIITEGLSFLEGVAMRKRGIYAASDQGQRQVNIGGAG